MRKEMGERTLFKNRRNDLLAEGIGVESRVNVREVRHSFEIGYLDFEIEEETEELGEGEIIFIRTIRGRFCYT